MKGFLTILCSLFLLGSGVRNDNYLLSRWVVESSSRLNIEGSSNISGFKCDMTEYLKNDTLCYSTVEAGNRLNFVNSCVTININSFDCHQRYITSDFKKTLKADQNPLLKIHFLSIDDFKPVYGRQMVNSVIEISLAGVVKRMHVGFNVKTINNSQIQLFGDKDLLFSDFGLKPPRKLAGLIKINEEIKVHFQLMLKSIN